MRLLTQAQFAKLLDNGQRQLAVRGTAAEHDFHPVVKLFDPMGRATWLLTEIEPFEHDIAWGLCDLGHGCPEFGSVSLSEIDAVHRRHGLPIERDLHFKADKPISAYADEAYQVGRIRA